MMMKKRFNILSILIFMAFTFLACDSFYESTFDQILGGTIGEEIPIEEKTIERKVLKSIYIKEMPVKTIYGIGDEFSTEGISVYAQYSKTENELDVTKNVSYKGFSSSEDNPELTITVSYTENGILAITTFTVSVFNDYVKVQSLVFEDDYKNIVVGLGNIFQMQVTVLPENASYKKVLWKSSDSSIASIDKDGVVTAIKEGFVTITAYSADVPEITAECTLESKYYHAERVSINVPETPIRIEETKTYQLTATVEPELAPQKVNWKSSDESIATIDENGLITAKKSGKVEITAISIDNSEVKASCNIDVFKYYVEAINLSETELEILVETQNTLTATVYPENATYKEYTWHSENESIATVDSNGVITAKKLTGEVEIIATSTDDPTITAVCKVTVFKYDVEAIQLNKTELELFVDASEALTATVSPENASYPQYVWSSDDENIATVTAEGVVTAINGGTTKIIATSVDNPDVKAECVVTVTEITELAPQDYQIGDVILKDGTFVSYDKINEMTSEQKSKAVAVIYGYRLEITDIGTESYALGIGLDHNSLAWCTEDSPGWNIDFNELHSSYSSDYVYDSEGNRVYVQKFTGNTDGSDDWDYICSQDSVGTADPATYYPAWDYVINYGANKGLKGYYKTGWYMPTIKEAYKFIETITTVSSIIGVLDGNIYNYTPIWMWTSVPRSSDTRYAYSIEYYESWYKDLHDGMPKSKLLCTVPIKAFPCSVNHYDDYTSKSISVTYPSYSGGDIIMTSQTDDDGNYTFTVTNSDSSELPENATYRWLLDTTLITEALGDSVSVSENGTELTLSKDYLTALVLGSHIITVLQRIEDGNLFDASCTINITNGKESTFKPQGNAVTVMIPVYTESTLTVGVQNNDDGSFTFTASDSDSSKLYKNYTWLLDNTTLSQTSSVLTLSASDIKQLVMGSHLITVLAKTDAGEYFDAQCYIKCYEEIEMPQDYKLLSPVICKEGTTIKWASVPYATGYKVYKYSSDSDLDIDNFTYSLFDSYKKLSLRSFTIPAPSLSYDYYAVKTCYGSEESEEFSNVIKISQEDIPELIESHSGSYYFTENNGTWTSNNSRMSSTSAVSSWTFNRNTQGKMIINWTVSSESGCDYLTISVDGSTIVNATGYDSGTESIDYTVGTIIEATYSKDGSVDDGLDCATLTFSFN